MYHPRAFYSPPLTLCTFYPLILSIFSTTSSHIITQVQYCSILSALGPAEKTRQCCQSQSTESPTYFRPLPSFLSEVFDLPGVAWFWCLMPTFPLSSRPSFPSPRISCSSSSLPRRKLRNTPSLVQGLVLVCSSCAFPCCLLLGLVLV